MGAAVSALSRRIQRFNFENRVHQEISREKPTRAPAYPSTIKEIERVSKEDPQSLDELSRKNLELHERLKNVYLKSYDIKDKTDSEATDPGKHLPVNRSPPEETDFGFLEPKMVPRGRVTLRQAMKFIAEYQGDPNNSDASAIAAKHNISLEMTENILKYFTAFEIFIPDDKKQIGGEMTTITQIEGGKPIDEK